MFSSSFQVTGKSEHRTIVNTAGHIAIITSAAATAGINMVGSSLAAMVPIFGNILESALEDGRIIVFHDSSLLQGIASYHDDIILLGGEDAKFRLEDGDGEFLAGYLHNNPKQSVVINLRHMNEDAAARLIGDFARSYAQLRPSGQPAELIATFGLSRIMMRKRHNTGDSQAVRSAMHQQLLSDELNIRIVNVARALSEIPIEFHTNTPNLLVFKLSTSKHYGDLASHLTAEQAALVRQFADDPECGVMHIGTGYATYFNPTDLPHDLRERPPYIIEATNLYSEIGNPYDGQGNEKKRKKLLDFVKGERAERAKQKAAEKEAQMRAKIADRVLAKLMGKEIETSILAQLDLAGIVAPRSGPAGATTPASDKLVLNKISCGGSLQKMLRDEGVTNHNQKGGVILGVAAYRATGGRTIVGQRLPLSDVMAVKDEILGLLPSFIKEAKNGFPVTLAAIAAVILKDEGKDFMAFLTGGSEGAEQALRKVEALKKEEHVRGAASDAAFSALIQGWRAHKAGTQVKRFTSAMPAPMLAANDTAAAAAAA